jgi:hypothetical protein
LIFKFSFESLPGALQIAKIRVASSLKQQGAAVHRYDCLRLFLSPPKNAIKFGSQFVVSEDDEQLNGNHLRNDEMSQLKDVSGMITAISSFTASNH